MTQQIVNNSVHAQTVNGHARTMESETSCGFQLENDDKKTKTGQRKL